ncbi:MAG: 3'(2'),5'-bisphosphate nucleotidase [Myxococcota bacterium]
MSWDAEVQVALAAVRQAATVCRAVQRDVDPLTLEKKDRSPVTVADFASQALVARALLDAFADDALVGEEDAAALREPANAERRAQVHGRVAAIVDAREDDVLRWIDHGQGDASQARRWVLDPVDGTKGFLRGEQYAVALALLVDDAVEVAVLGCPNLPLRADAGAPVGTAFVAVRGQGAQVAPLFDDAKPQPIRVSARADLSTVRLCESVESGHSAHDLSAQVVERLGLRAEPVRLDSQAKYGVVARGDAELYLRLPTRKDYVEKIWDHAAGACVVQEAGGTVTDVDGRPLDLGHGRHLAQNRGIVASHGPHHARVLETLRALNI